MTNSTNFSKSNPNSTNFAKSSSNSTNFAKSNPNSTGYERRLFNVDSSSNLLLQNSDDLLQQDGLSVILFESGQYSYTNNYAKGSINSTNYS